MKPIKKYYLLSILVLFLNCFIGNTVRLFDGAERSSDLLETTIEGNSSDKVLLISIDGVISDSPSPTGFLGLGSSDSMVARIKEELSKASFDPYIKGIILKINSPGGGVTASDLIYREISKFKQEKNIPIVALFMDTAASGGYYVAMSSDYIVAHPTTVTGSIGVIISSINVKQGLDKIGVKDQSITSGPNKAILSPLQEMSPEQRTIIQSVVDGMYEKFLEKVKSNRKQISEVKLRQLADGRIYTAEQALKEKLIDRIGYFEDAVGSLMKADTYRGTGAKPRIITYTYNPRKPLKNVYQVNDKILEESNIEKLLKVISDKDTPKFLYLWKL
ncbi:MAG: signal peptide peptidase SppA [Leptospiraceae bacterium]|nr:signal peptide peptidase SppA [Leptospiraceae bacterium]